MYVLIQLVPNTHRVVCLGVYRKNEQAIADAMLETNKYIHRNKMDLSKLRFSTVYEMDAAYTDDEFKDDKRRSNMYMDAYYEDEKILNYWLLIVDSNDVEL